MTGKIKTIFASLIMISGCMLIPLNAYSVAASCYLCCNDTATGVGEDCTPIGPDEPCRQYRCSLGCSISSNNECSLCSVGSYGNDGLSCSTCTKPAVAQFVGNTYGLTTDNCSWQIRCGVGAYFEDEACVSCPQYYEGNGKSYTCEGSGPGIGNCQNQSYTSFCTGKRYDIYLNPNMEYNIPTSSNYKSKTMSYKYKAGYGCGNSAYNTTGISGGADCWNQPTRNYLEFTGYFTEGGEQVIDSNGNIASSYQGDTVMYFVDTTRTLYAHYNIKEIKVCYAKSADGKKENCHSFTVEDNNSSADRKVKAVSRNYFVDGKLFSHWDCWDTDTKGKCLEGRTYKPNDVLEFSNSVNRVLVPVYTDCPAGYYCKNNVQNACPGGSTSAVRSSKIGDCYLAGGNDGTKFIDGAGNSFVLPAGATIFYMD